MAATGNPGTRISRRRFAAVGAAAAGTLAWQPARANQEITIEGTPPAAPAIAPAPSPAESAATIAASLGFDREALVAFVRDEIAYEPYAGVLRGATGTIRARAGNSADQAVLLAELLAASRIDYRFAAGPLDDAAIQALLDSLPTTPEEAGDRYLAAVEASTRHTLGIDDLTAEAPALDDLGSDLPQRADASSEAVEETAVATTGIALQAISGAISNVGGSLPPLPPASLPDREITRHLWVQVPDGPDWIDLDPSLPGDATPPVATETFSTLPEDWHHNLRFVIVADEWYGGFPTPREVVSLDTSSAAAVEVPIALSMASADELEGLGGALNELFAGQKSIYPTIYAGGLVVEPISPIMFGVSGEDASDALGSGTTGLQESETVAVWLVTEIASPDREIITISRPLLDRLSPEQRVSGVIEPESVPPIELVPTTLGADTPQPFDGLTVLHVDVARMPPFDDIVRSTNDQIFGPFGSMGPVLAGFRDTIGLDLEGEAGYWSFPSGPNITAFHSSGGETPVLRVDLIRRERTSLALGDGAAGTHPLVLSGVLDAIAEQLLLLPETRGETAGESTYGTGPSIGAIFAAADEAGVAIRLVQAAADAQGTPLDTLNPIVTAALDEGKWIIAPEQAVTIDGIEAFGWWIVDPATGTTRDHLADGTAGASMRLPRRSVFALGNIPGYSFLTRAIAWVVANSGKLACLGVGVAWGFLYAKATIKALRGNGGGVVAGGVVSAGGMAGYMAFC